MGQIKFMSSMVMIALFAIAIVVFSGMFAIDNNSMISIDNDTDYSGIRDNIESNIKIYYGEVNTSAESMYKSTISSQTEATEGGTSFKVGIGTGLSLAKTSITTAYTKIFGEDSGFGIFFTALLSVLGLISFMYIYKTWAGRNPD